MKIARSLIILPLLLAACIQQRPQTESPATPPPVETEAKLEGEDIVDPVALAQAQSGTTLPERLLPTGILEIGHRETPLVLLSFTNHHCRYCADFQSKLMPKLMKDFMETGMLRYQVAILPLKKYPQSRTSSTALICAASQGKGLAMHELLFSLSSIDEKTIDTGVEQWPFDRDIFRVCMADPAVGVRIDDLESMARSLDTTLVPAFFLNGEKFVGLPEYAELRGRIEQMEAEKQNP